MNLWIVAIYRDNGDENEFYFETLPTKQHAVELYEELKSDIQEQCDDIGFTGDEGVYIAKVTDALLAVTETDEEETSFHFKWEEFKEEHNGFYLTEDAYMKLMESRGTIKCDYCKGIDESTKKSPRRKYKFCPMCGRLRDEI